MKAEKWIDSNSKVINPAYVEELEAFAKEMAEFIVNRSKGGYALCGWCGSTTIMGGSIDHVMPCPVPRAEEYLKQ